MISNLMSLISNKSKSQTLIAIHKSQNQNVERKTIPTINLPQEAHHKLWCFVIPYIGDKQNFGISFSHVERDFISHIKTYIVPPPKRDHVTKPKLSKKHMKVPQVPEHMLQPQFFFDMFHYSSISCRLGHSQALTNSQGLSHNSQKNVHKPCVALLPTNCESTSKHRAQHQQ